MPFKEKIQIVFRAADILLGITIYIKVSVDFAIFMGNLIKSNPGWTKRIAIEVGTSIGNGLGTLLILAIWVLFRRIEIILIVMIIISSLVLLKMAEEGINDFLELKIQGPFSEITYKIGRILHLLNKLTNPIIGKIVPQGKILGKGGFGFFSLIVFSFAIPFILGLDDFAGYIPLFSIVNVVSFSIGVFIAHTLLTTSLFISPKNTVAIVEKPIIIIMGSFAFILIAAYGFYEVLRMIL